MITSIDAFPSIYIRQESKKQLMTRISIPYGNETVYISVPEKNIADIVYPREVGIRDSYSVLQEAIRNPLGKPMIGDILQTKVPVLIIVNDATRPTRTSMVLETIKHYVQNEHLQFIVATGAHRAPTEQELRTIFGKYYQEYETRILIHDSQNKESLEYHGKTRYGNELWLNKAVARFERIFVIGSVEPHYFAGFTGGRKSILPGIAGYDTIEQNHKFDTHPKAQPYKLNCNIIH
jgi:nickel-dependent lactate racemase